MSNYQKQLDVLTSMFEMTKDNNDNGDVVIICRQVLEKAIRLIFEYRNVKTPYNASLLELINNEEILDFFDNDVMIDSLHFIRIVGKNAQNKRHIKRTQAMVACNNTEYLLLCLEDKLGTKQQVNPTVIHNNVQSTNTPVSLQKKSSMSEAETRKTYIDTYLNEAGWEVLPPNNTYQLANGKKCQNGYTYASESMY